MFTIRRVWRNGSVLSEEVICETCKSVYEEFGEEGLDFSEEQTFTVLPNPAPGRQCECDAHAENVSWYGEK